MAKKKESNNFNQLELQLFSSDLQSTKIIEEDTILPDPPFVASVTDKQNSDSDFSTISNKKKNQNENVKDLWEERTNYISQIVKSVPKPTEVWFIFSYPKAEDVVARFAKQTLVPEHWFGKKRAKDTLQTTPLYLQLLSITTRPGFRSSGAVPTALKNAKQAFEQFNKDISTKRISDQRFNRAICLALQNALSDQPGFNVQYETKHPYLENIRPDVLVDTEKKLVCLEFCYTNDNTPGCLADYVLRKLNQYMKQLENNFEIPEDLYR